MYPAQIPDSESMAITDKVMTVWTNIANYGDPSTPGGIDSWPEYETAGNKLVEIGAGGSLTVINTGLAGSFGTY